jgi:hypothetical protein
MYAPGTLGAASFLKDSAEEENKIAASERTLKMPMLKENQFQGAGARDSESLRILTRGLTTTIYISLKG